MDRSFLVENATIMSRWRYGRVVLNYRGALGRSDKLLNRYTFIGARFFTSRFDALFRLVRRSVCSSKFCTLYSYVKNVRTAILRPATCVLCQSCKSTLYIMQHVHLAWSLLIKCKCQASFRLRWIYVEFSSKKSIWLCAILTSSKFIVSSFSIRILLIS